MRSLYNISYLVGPTLGGIIYALGGIQLAFFFTGLSLTGSAVSEMFIQYHQETRKFEKMREVVTDLKEGISFIKIHRGVLTFLIFALVTNFFLSPIGSILVPYVLRVVIEFSAEQFGMLQTSFVVGTLAGNIIIGTVLARAKIDVLLKRGLISGQIFNLMFGVLILPKVMGFLGYASWITFSAIFVIFVFRGFSIAFVNTPISVGLQKLVPTEYRARVFSVMELVTMGIMPIGVGVVGILLDMAPAHLIAFGMFIANFCVVLVFVFKYLGDVAEEFEHREQAA